MIDLYPDFCKSYRKECNFDDKKRKKHASHIRSWEIIFNENVVGDGPKCMNRMFSNFHIWFNCSNTVKITVMLVSRAGNYGTEIPVTYSVCGS